MIDLNQLASISQNSEYIGWSMFIAAASITLILLLTEQGEPQSTFGKIILTVYAISFLGLLQQFQKLLGWSTYLSFTTMLAAILLTAEMLFYVYKGMSFTEFLHEFNRS